jgi:hypothetical protein
MHSKRPNLVMQPMAKAFGPSSYHQQECCTMKEWLVWGSCTRNYDQGLDWATSLSFLTSKCCAVRGMTGLGQQHQGKHQRLVWAREQSCTKSGKRTFAVSQHFFLRGNKADLGQVKRQFCQTKANQSHFYLQPQFVRPRHLVRAAAQFSLKFDRL